MICYDWLQLVTWMDGNGYTVFTKMDFQNNNNLNSKTITTLTIKPKVLKNKGQNSDNLNPNVKTMKAYNKPR